MKTAYNWDEIPRGSKITLKNKFWFKGFNGFKKVMNPGTYYISGFWANACGLVKDKKELKTGRSDYFIPAINLKKFEEVNK